MSARDFSLLQLEPPENHLIWSCEFSLSQRLTKSQVSGIDSGHLHLSYLQMKPHCPIYFFLLMSSQSSPQTLSISRKGIWLFIPILLPITMYAQKYLTWDYKMAQVLRAFAVFFKELGSVISTHKLQIQERWSSLLTSVGTRDTCNKHECIQAKYSYT